MKKCLATSLLALSGAMALTSLHGCAAVAVGGAAAAGGLIATNRRDVNTQALDQRIELEASRRVHDAIGDTGRVKIVSYYRKVLLTGEVPTQAVLEQVATIVSGTPDVQSVVNALAVMPNASLSQRSSDTTVTARVKANLLNTNGVPANSIKVLTVRGQTYLMGRLTQRETALATEVARTTDGVQRVVRVIDQISEQEALHPNDSSGQNKAAPVSSAGGVPQGQQVDRPAVQTHPVQAPPAVQEQAPVEVEELPPLPMQ